MNRSPVAPYDPLAPRRARGFRPAHAVLALLAGLGVACGGGSPGPAGPSGTAGPSGGSTTAGTGTPSAGAAPDAGVAVARARGALRVAADTDAPPFLSKDAQGNWEGYEYAIVRAVADRAGLPLEIVHTPFSGLVDAVRSGAADLAVGQLSPSASWEGVDWSVSYLQYGFCLVVPADSPVKALPELKGKRVGMYDDPVARQLADVLIGASYERQVFDDYGYFEKMVRGQLDAMVYDCPLARYEMKTFGERLRIADDALNVATYAAAVPKGDAETLALVNGVLKDLGEQGLLASLQERLLGEKTSDEAVETATGKVVRVRRGDSLSLIAQRELGSTEKWRDLHAANRDVVGPDPNTIYVGMRLRLPR